jgi:hypothetical protein
MGKATTDETVVESPSNRLLIPETVGVTAEAASPPCSDPQIGRLCPFNPGLAAAWSGAALVPCVVVPIHLSGWQCDAALLGDGLRMEKRDRGSLPNSPRGTQADNHNGGYSVEGRIGSSASLGSATGRIVAHVY